MPLHSTDDLGKRAASIADKEAEKVWRKTGIYDAWKKIWLDTYRRTLKEFNWGS